MQDNENNEQGPISLDTIYDMVSAAMNIPSVAMGRSTQFVVLNEIEALSRASEIFPGSPSTMRALTAIVVCGDLNGAQIKDRWMSDCEAASQQIQLTAHANGLGAYISSVYPDPGRVRDMSALLGLPDHIIAHSYVAMGYPVRTRSVRAAFNNERVHFNIWA